MTAWAILQCLYLVAGGNIAPLLISVLFVRDQSWTALREAVPSFVIVFGVVLLWPMLLLLILEAE